MTTLLEGGYNFQTFREYLENPGRRVVILRHDVDMRPEYALRMAQIERHMAVKGTYYFRAMPVSWNVQIIKKISDMGHEVGYHYENMDTAGKMLFGKSSFIFKKSLSEEDEVRLVDTAYDNFIGNLNRLREVIQVDTIAMHGSPRSRFNNLDLWKKYDYSNLDILGEPYLDVDYSEVFYLTDTGRRWDGERMSIRDRVVSGFNVKDHKYRSTGQIIEAVKADRLPPRVMINVHPQRWTNNYWMWSKELVWQNVKNLVKRLIILKNGEKLSHK